MSPFSQPGSGHAENLGAAEEAEAVHESRTDLNFGGPASGSRAGTRSPKDLGPSASEMLSCPSLPERPAVVSCGAEFRCGSGQISNPRRSARKRVAGATFLPLITVGRCTARSGVRHAVLPVVPIPMPAPRYADEAGRDAGAYGLRGPHHALRAFRLMLAPGKKILTGTLFAGGRRACCADQGRDWGSIPSPRPTEIRRRREGMAGTVTFTRQRRRRPRRRPRPDPGVLHLCQGRGDWDRQAGGPCRWPVRNLPAPGIERPAARRSSAMVCRWPFPAAPTSCRA